MKRLLSFCLIALTLCVPSYAADETALSKKTVTSLQYVKAKLAERQDKVEAQSGTKAMTYGNNGSYDPGETSARDVKTSLGSSTTDPALPTVGAVNTGLNAKQNKIPAKDTNTVVTYTGTSGVIGEKGIYQNNGSYAAQSDNLVDAGTFNAALKTGLDSEFICADSDSSTGLCWLWTIHNEGKSRNLFDMDRIPESTSTLYPIHHNEDGSITVATNTSGNSAITTNRTLSQLAPGLEIGKTYVFSINTTGTSKYIYLSTVRQTWQNGLTKTITQDMLNSTVSVYASGVNTSATIYNIQIEEGTTPTAFQPYLPPRSYTTLVPDEYTPVEYLESSGTQWIDTGYILTSSNVVYKWTAKDLNTSGSTSLFGSEVNTNPKYAGILHGSNTGRSLYVGSSTGRSVGYKSNDGNFHSWVLNIKSDGSVSLLKDEAIVGTSTWTTPIQQSKSISVFSNNGKGQFSTVAFKSFSIIDNNTLVVNLIPARRNSDNVLGMYDTVSGTFKTNAGSGTFTAGPDINNNVYVPQGQ